LNGRRHRRHYPNTVRQGRIRFKPIWDRYYELRKELGLPEGPLAGVFSRLAPWKGQHVVLQTLAKLQQLQCIIVGDSLFGEQDYALKLREMADRLQLGERVHFLGHRGDVPRLMQAVDVIIHPSVAAEPFGRTLVEAMLAGVPLIATDTGAAFDILDGGKAGTLVRPNDFEDLAVAVSNVLNGPAELPKQLVHAVTRARANYGVGKMLDAVSDIIVHVGMRARA
jgi:glycosyltransferase involved in cell wall biosynthesis